MKLLFLGGTQFLGRHLIQAAEMRGHQVTLFNRGRTNPDLFPHLEKLRGDRDGDLGALEGRSWDAVVDTCGFSSAKVVATAGLLRERIGHYTFISSISVYQDFSRPGLAETAPVEILPTGSSEDEGDSATYGARKALCEKALERILPGRVLNVRPGLIVGPHETNGRFRYWVRRVTRGGDILAPADPDARVQLIDARDLAEWIIRMAEAKKVGTFNATGPEETLTLAQMLHACRVDGIDTRFVWPNEKFLIEKGITPFTDLPFWLPAKTHNGFFAVDCRRAFASGLVCRELSETVRDTRMWEESRTAGCITDVHCGLRADREQELLRNWGSS